MNKTFNAALEVEKLNSIKNDKVYLTQVLNLIKSKIDKDITRVEVYGTGENGKTVKFKAYKPKCDGEEYILVEIAILG